MLASAPTSRGAGTGNQTPVIRLEGASSVIELYPQYFWRKNEGMIPTPVGAKRLAIADRVPAAYSSVLVARRGLPRPMVPARGLSKARASRASCISTLP